MDRICPNNEKSLVYQPIAFIDPKAVYISQKEKGHFSFKKLVAELLAHPLLTEIRSRVIEGWS